MWLCCYILNIEYKYTNKNVAVVISDVFSSYLRFNRQTDLHLEHHIKEVWAERLSKEPWLFNGAKFRLHSFCLASPKHPHYTQAPCVPLLHCAEEQEKHKGDGDAARHGVDLKNGCINQTESFGGSTGSAADCHSHAGPLLILRLGLTCYKDYLGTNWSCQVAELRRHGEEEFGDPLALLAQPLGVGAVMCTDDGQVVLIRRSQKVAEAGGLLDIPGGHPEPKVKGIKVSLL